MGKSMLGTSGFGRQSPWALPWVVCWAVPAGAGAADTAPPAAPPTQAIEVRAGALVPAQVLDGASVRLAAAWRRALGAGLWVAVETGASRTTISALGAPLSINADTLTVRADHTQWTVPGLLGVAWGGDDGDARWGLALLGGVAWTHASLDSAVAGGDTYASRSDDRADWIGVARVDLSWPVTSGEVVAGGGWQATAPLGAPPATGDVRATGLFLEAGWRALF